jgi:hypothetical protein
VANVASVLSSDQADNHFATLADGAGVILGIVALCTRRLPLGLRVAGAIAAGICLTFLVLRVVNGTI